MKQIYAPLIALTLLCGCSTPKYYQGFQTGRDYWSELPKNERKVFDAGADFATNDYMQRLYAAERNAQQYDLPGARSKQPKRVALEKKIVRVPVEGYVDTDGVQHEASYRFIEVNTVQ